MPGLPHSCRLADFAGVFAGILQIPNQNPDFFQSTRALKQTLFRLPGSPLGVQTSPYSTEFGELNTHYSFQYGHDVKELDTNV